MRRKKTDEIIEVSQRAFSLLYFFFTSFWAPSDKACEH